MAVTMLRSTRPPKPVAAIVARPSRRAARSDGGSAATLEKVA